MMLVKGLGVGACLFAKFPKQGKHCFDPVSVDFKAGLKQ